MVSESSNNIALARETLLNIKRAILLLKEWNANVTSTDEWVGSPLGMQKLAGNSMMIETIGESVKKIEKQMGMEFLNQCPEIPWREIMGMRNHIAHGYFDIDDSYVLSVIQNDLDPLLIAVESLISETEKQLFEQQVDWHQKDAE